MVWSSWYSWKFFGKYNFKIKKNLKEFSQIKHNYDKYKIARRKVSIWRDQHLLNIRNEIQSFINKHQLNDYVRLEKTKTFMRVTSKKLYSILKDDKMGVVDADNVEPCMEEKTYKTKRTNLNVNRKLKSIIAEKNTQESTMECESNNKTITFDSIHVAKNNNTPINDNIEKTSKNKYKKR